MRAQEFDAFALRSYSFAVRKTNSYFSITTLLLSAAIITASLLINMTTLSNLWLPLEALPRQSSTSLSFPNPLTSTLLCYRSNVNGEPVPPIKVFDQSKNQVHFALISQEVVKRDRPLLSAKMGQNFGCMNLQGITFSQANKRYYFQVDSPSASLFLQSLSENQVLKQEQSILIEMNATLQSGYVRNVRIIYAAIQDSLFVNSQPKVVETIYQDKEHINELSAQGYFEDWGNGNYSMFMVQLFLPYYELGNLWLNYNRVELSVTRLDFGVIVGSLLSWVSILALACSVVAGPVMERALQLLQSEALFHIPSQFKAPSLSRFIAAPLGLFPKEAAFLSLSQKLEQLKDIAKTLKIVKTIRKITPSSSRSSQVLVSEQNFGQQQNLDPGVGIFSASKGQQACFEGSQDQPRQSCLQRWRKTLLHKLDAGSDNISVNYSKSGHGSRQSLCLSILFFFGFIVFLSLFGVFDFSTVTTIYQTIGNSPFTYSISYNEIILATNEQSEIIAALIDGNANILANLTLSNSSDCFRGLTQQQMASLSGFSYRYCFTESLALAQSDNPDKVSSLYISNVNFVFQPVDIFHFSPPSPTSDYTPFDNYAQTLSYSMGINVYIEQNLKLTRISYQGQINATFAQFTLAKQLRNGLNNLAGVNIVLSDTQTVIDYTSNTFFDIVQNVWGFAVICFTVLLMKLTKYINLREKERTMSRDRMEFRDSLCILLAKIDGLVSGRHREELGRMKYYTKEPLPR